MHGELATSRLAIDRERVLVARARSDASAFGELYDFYLPRIYGYVYRRVGDRSTAEDLTAMTFERALGAIRRDGFRNDSFGGWLYRVAANVVVDHVRRGRRTERLAVSRAEQGSGASAAPETADERAADAFAAALDRAELRAAFARLPEQQQRLLTLKYVDDLDVDELCSVLSCSRGTLAVRLHRALRALRDAMAKEASDAA